MNRILKVVLFILILLSGLVGLAVYWTFYRPLPDYETTLTLQGLQDNVNIHWDAYGVPHIYANNDHDLYFAVGFTHAQDRLWQMTLTQMAAEGRLAEFLGKDVLPYDQFQRTIGFWRIAKKIEDHLPAHTRSVLQAYADGVNAYVSSNPRSLPIEFSLVDMEPIPWTVTHTIALARMMAWELNVAWKSELNYSLLYQQLDSGKFHELFPSEKLWASEPVKSPGTPHRMNYTAAFLPLLNRSEELRQLMGTKGSHTGSNAWAVDASKTTTEYPLLAGDPHLGLNMPGKWYEVHLNLRDRNLSGATLPGAPIMVLGQNDVLAWSLTNVMTDDTDFYEELVNPDNSGQYVLDSLAGEAVYENFEIQREVIKIRGADDTTFTRKLTKHGPVISDIYPEQHVVGNRVITMQWSGYEVTHEVDALLEMNWARSLEEFRSAVSKFKVPGQNIVYADREGNIARFSAVNVPIRTDNPILLRQGWKSEQDWQGYIPFENLPHSVNPEKGWVANANNPIVPENYPYYVSTYWEPDSRYERIVQYLSRNDIMTTQIFQVMQNDSYSDFAREMTAYVLPVLNNSENKAEFNTAISYLENWDYRYDPSETAASIMDVFLLRLSENVLKDEMGADIYENYIGFSAMPVRTLHRFMQDGSTFYDDIKTPNTESREDMIRKSMRQALGSLKNTLGEEPFEWRWEQLHTITLKPPLFGEAAADPDAPAALKLIVNNLLSKGPFPARGNSMSLNNGEYSWNDPYEMVLGPSIRRIVDLSDLSKTLTILPTGQSGNPLSEYYGDQTDSWLTGHYKFLYQDNSFFNENQYRTMTLVPETGEPKN